MAAADQNYKLADVNLPDSQLSRDLRAYVGELVQAIIRRDFEVKSKINQLHIEYVTEAPSDAPDEPEPVLRIYFDDPNYYLYVYIGSAWRSVALT